MMLSPAIKIALQSQTAENIYKRMKSRQKQNTSESEGVEILSQLSLSRNSTYRRKWLREKKRCKYMDKFTLLLVDDSDFEKDTIITMIKRCGIDFQIFMASNGLEAFEKVKEKSDDNVRFHLILMDLNMPDYNGFDGASMIRNYERKYDQPRTYICILSAESIENSKKQTDYEVDTFVMKPFTFEKLNKIMMFIDKHLQDNLDDDSILDDKNHNIKTQFDLRVNDVAYQPYDSDMVANPDTYAELKYKNMPSMSEIIERADESYFDYDKSFVGLAGANRKVTDDKEGLLLENFSKQIRDQQNTPVLQEKPQVLPQQDIQEKKNCTTVTFGTTQAEYNEEIQLNPEVLKEPKKRSGKIVRNKKKKKILTPKSDPTPKYNFASP